MEAPISPTTMLAAPAAIAVLGLVLGPPATLQSATAAGCSSSSACSPSLHRRDFISGAAAAVAALGVAPAAHAETTTKSGIGISVFKSGPGTGSSPVIGDLIVIRFKCALQKGGAVIDNILDNPEGYYFRVGSGQVLPAVEEVVVKMKSGDVWDLTVPPTMGFGTKGRSASPGKPRIPGDAILDFRLELVAVPGKDEEIIDVNGVID